MVRSLLRSLPAALALVGACSFSRPADVTPTDAQDVAADGGPDALVPPPDASARGTVRVTVMDPAPTGMGAPKSGVAVVFLDPDGSMAATVLTDADGKAQADVLPGGSVTSVYKSSATAYEMDSVLGVKPGDDLAIDPVPDRTPVGTFTVRYPQYTNAVLYCATGPCSEACTPGGYAPIVLPFYRYCAQDPMTVAVTAHTDFGGGFASYLDQDNVSFADGGAVMLTGTWSGLKTSNVTITDIPADVSYQIQARFAPDLAGVRILYPQGSVAGGVVTTTASVPASVTATIEADFRKTSNSSQYIFQRVPGNPQQYNLDAGANLLPWINAATLDVDTGMVTVPSSGSGSGDVFQVRLAYSRTTAQTTTSFTWTVVAAKPADFTLPAMPATVGAVNPRSGDTTTTLHGASNAVLVDADNITGYDTARAMAFKIASLAQSGIQVSGGTVVPWPKGTTMVRVSASPYQP